MGDVPGIKVVAGWPLAWMDPGQQVTVCPKHHLLQEAFLTYQASGPLRLTIRSESQTLTLSLQAYSFRHRWRGRLGHRFS